MRSARTLLDGLRTPSGKVDAGGVIERDGVPTGASVPRQGSPRLGKPGRQWSQLARLLTEARARFSNVPPEEIERETGKVLARSGAPARDVSGVAETLEEDLVLATAPAGGAAHLVTGAHGLLSATATGVRPRSPADVRLVLEAEDATGRRWSPPVG